MKEKILSLLEFFHFYVSIMGFGVTDLIALDLCSSGNFVGAVGSWILGLGFILSGTIVLALRGLSKDIEKRMRVG